MCKTPWRPTSSVCPRILTNLRLDSVRVRTTLFGALTAIRLFRKITQGIASFGRLCIFWCLPCACVVKSNSSSRHSSSSHCSHSSSSSMHAHWRVCVLRALLERTHAMPSTNIMTAIRNYAMGLSVRERMRMGCVCCLSLCVCAAV